MLTLLQAQPPVTANSSEIAVRVLAVLGVLIVVLLVCGLLVRRFRRGLLGDSGTDGSPPLLLDDLRDMKRRGQISDAEYERMRMRLVEKLSGRSRTALSASDVPAAAPIKGRPQSGGAPEAGGEARRAAPGFDLTGEPLPRPAPGE